MIVSIRKEQKTLTASSGVGGNTKESLKNQLTVGAIPMTTRTKASTITTTIRTIKIDAMIGTVVMIDTVKIALNGNEFAKIMLAPTKGHRTRRL